jgi:hypothetical protein
MTAGLLALAGLIAVLLLPCGFHMWFVFRLWRTGRTIQWPEALERIKSGNGFLVKNRSTLPGRLWWISTEAKMQCPSGMEMFSSVKEHGLVVIWAPRNWETIVSAQVADGRIVELFETFED